MISPYQVFGNLADKNGRWLLIVVLVAFESVLLTMVLLVVLDKVTFNDIKGQAAALGGFLFGYLSNSPLSRRPAIPIVTDPTPPTQQN